MHISGMDSYKSGTLSLMVNSANAMATLKIICRETYKKPCSIKENMENVAVAISNIFEIKRTFYLSQVCMYVTVMCYSEWCKHDMKKNHTWYFYHQDFIKHQTCMVYQVVVTSSMHAMIA